MRHLGPHQSSYHDLDENVHWAGCGLQVLRQRCCQRGLDGCLADLLRFFALASGFCTLSPPEAKGTLEVKMDLCLRLRLPVFCWSPRCLARSALQFEAGSFSSRCLESIWILPFITLGSLRHSHSKSISIKPDATPCHQERSLQSDDRNSKPSKDPEQQNS